MQPVLRPPTFPAPIIADKFRDEWFRGVQNYWGGPWTASLQLLAGYSTREQEEQQERPEGRRRGRERFFSMFSESKAERGFCPETKSLPYKIHHLSC